MEKVGKLRINWIEKKNEIIIYNFLSLVFTLNIQIIIMIMLL